VTERGVVDHRERRRDPRYAVNCRCWLEQDSVTLFGTVTNLSTNGLFLRTLPIVREGTCVDVRLSLAEGVVTGKGAVRWRAQSGLPGTPVPHPASGIGIEILSVTAGGEFLERFLAETAHGSQPLP
jgi:hypothetical protein